MMEYKNNLAGFTLVELMITVAIISIAIAIAAPNLLSFVSATRTKGVAENLAQDLILARNEAIRLNQTVRLDVRSSCYGFSNKATSCNCTVTDTSASNYCDLKRVGDWPGITLLADTGQFNAIMFDASRGLPLNTSGTLTSAQNLSISNANNKAILKMNIIGNVCISSPAGSTKMRGYPDAC